MSTAPHLEAERESRLDGQHPRTIARRPISLMTQQPSIRKNSQQSYQGRFEHNFSAARSGGELQPISVRSVTRDVSRLLTEDKANI